MDKLIEVRVTGSYLHKDSRTAGPQHEANATKLRIEFDESWDGLAKTVTFWDATGEVSVKRTLTTDLLEDLGQSTRVYLCPIPGEAMAQSGDAWFVIDGYVEGKRQRSFSSELNVPYTPYAPEATDPSDPTPTQAEQLQGEIEALMEDIQQAVQAAETAEAAVETANQASSTASSAVNTANQAVQSASAAVQAAEDALAQLENSDHATHAEVEAAQNAATAAQNSVNSHAGNAQNPHGVTAGQIGAADAGHNHAGQCISPSALELNPGTGAAHGGYIDFHYGGSALDHTSRIIEEPSNTLQLHASNGVKVSASNVAGLRVRNISIGTNELTEGAAATGYNEGDIHIVV